MQKIRVPDPQTPWSLEVMEFALSYNGYYRHGGSKGAGAIGNGLLEMWHLHQRIEADLPALRCALFFEQRRARHMDSVPDADYLFALLTAIHEQTGGWVDGPADDFHG